MPTNRASSGSAAEDLFIDLFADTFGAEKAGYLYSQYPFFDIYQNSRFADFVLENGSHRIAFENLVFRKSRTINAQNPLKSSDFSGFLVRVTGFEPAA